MTYHSGDMGSQTVLVVRVSEAVHAEIKNASVYQCLPMAEVVRRMLENHLDLKRPPRPRESVAAPVDEPREVETYSVVDLCERGYTGQQIAAITKLTYKQVLGEIAAAADHIAALEKALGVAE